MKDIIEKLHIEKVKVGTRLKEKELTKVRHKKEQSSESTLGQENYSPEVIIPLL